MVNRSGSGVSLYSMYMCTYIYVVACPVSAYAHSMPSAVRITAAEWDSRTAAVVPVADAQGVLQVMK